MSNRLSGIRAAFEGEWSGVQSPGGLQILMCFCEGDPSFVLASLVYLAWVPILCRVWEREIFRDCLGRSRRDTEGYLLF